MLKPSLQLRMGQSLTMTPQLQQAIRLLQLSTLELQTQIQEVLAENPMLDVSEEHEQETEAEANTTESIESLSSDTVAEDSIPEDLPIDSKWDDIYDMPSSSTSSGMDGEQRDVYENQAGPGEGLQEHLLWQMQLTSMSDTDRVIATAIIDAVDENGYLSETLKEIYDSLKDQFNAPLDISEVEAVLHLVQHFDPISCAVHNLQECLHIQLEQLPDETHLQHALALVDHHLDLLASHDYKHLMRELGVNEETLQEVVMLIQTLNPRPGRLIGSKSAEYIIPDVFVRKYENQWLVDLNPDIAPRLKINSLYASLIKRADQSADNVYMRNHLQEARWFIKSLQSRNETLLKVARSIVQRQRGFLDYGEEAMKPLVLRDIAEQLDMHESTISRVTTNKYMHTPRGIVELKYFFSSHVGTDSGGECSATAIRAMIRKFIAQENTAKPLSDNKIATILREQGINVARRTVAKYRESMAIPPSNERKRLA